MNFLFMVHLELLELLYLKAKYKPRFIYSGANIFENILQDMVVSSVLKGKAYS